VNQTHMILMRNEKNRNTIKNIPSGGLLILVLHLSMAPMTIDPASAIL
jgi:hypothetical protein